MNDIPERPEPHQLAFACYQKYIAAARCLTAVELWRIPELVDLHGLDLFREVVEAAGNKASLSSPIRYIEVALEKEAKRKLYAAQERVNEIARDEPIERYSDETRHEALEKAAAAGHQFAREALERGK